MHLSKRSFLCAGAASVVTLLTNSSASAQAETQYADLDLADSWLREWMSEHKKSYAAATGALHLGRFADPMYFLREPIGWSPEAGQDSVNAVAVPVGFVTDFASIPRVFWSALRPDGDYTYPAILHDYLYWMQPVSRAEADMVFKYAMEEFRVPKATVAAVYNAVSLGGKSAWNANASLRANGEKRILKKFPEKPTIRWNEWKETPGVFA